MCENSVFYYILVDPDKIGRCKIGITKNPDERIRSYRTANPDCYFKKIYSIPDKIHEKRILSLLKNVFTVRSEYVYCSPNIAQNIIEGYFDDNDIQY